MNWTENILIICGVSLEIFAAMECQGALLAKIDKKHLAIMCAFIGVCQMGALYIGNFLSTLFIRRGGSAENEYFLGNVLSAVIFFCLGIRLIKKAIKNERIQERREENLNMKRLLFTSLRGGTYTLLAGIAFGFIGTSTAAILIMIVLVSIAAVIGGIYVGYHFGFEQKQIAYVAGAVLLFAAGIDVVLRYILGF